MSDFIALCEDSIVWLTDDHFPSREEMGRAGYTTPGWYFWDADAADCIGPFAGKADALARLRRLHEALDRMKNSL